MNIDLLLQGNYFITFAIDFQDSISSVNPRFQDSISSVLKKKLSFTEFKKLNSFEVNGSALNLISFKTVELVIVVTPYPQWL